MDVMQMAAAVSLTDLHNEISGVEGPYYWIRDDPKEGANAIIWLKNGYGVDLRQFPARNPVGSGTAELGVRRLINDRTARGGQRSVRDYSTPVTNYVVPGATVDDVVSALRILSGLVNDPEGKTVRKAR